ncbi:FxSxx-COOH cyclophane-containing RiPP peptide [Micromonospora sp. NPDC049903]|uniref:FxSxx-COOH cyclophane-containing RiPP peptide n=1 Tax=Micromonospora sp. NPDC049903 TaxID=3364276 RepID=UPI0037B4873C
MTVPAVLRKGATTAITIDRTSGSVTALAGPPVRANRCHSCLLEAGMGSSDADQHRPIVPGARLIADGDPVSDLVDINGLSLADLRDLPDTAINRSLRRVLHEIDRPQDAVAGFQSAV